MRLKIIFGILVLMMQMGCIVGGYSNRGGWFLWPGGILGVLLLVALLFLVLRRR